MQDATDDIATTTDSAVAATETNADDTADQKEGEEEPSTVVQEKGEEVANSDPVREKRVNEAHASSAAHHYPTDAGWWGSTAVKSHELTSS